MMLCTCLSPIPLQATSYKILTWNPILLHRRRRRAHMGSQWTSSTSRPIHALRSRPFWIVKRRLLHAAPSLLLQSRALTALTRSMRWPSFSNVRHKVALLHHTCDLQAHIYSSPCSIIDSDPAPLPLLPVLTNPSNVAFDEVLYPELVQESLELELAELDAAESAISDAEEEELWSLTLAAQLKHLKVGR